MNTSIPAQTLPANPPKAGIPIAVAVLALFYAALATLAAASMVRPSARFGPMSGAWYLGWVALGGTAALGLFFQRAWARDLVRFSSVLLAGIGLWAVTAYLAAGKPLLGIAASCFSGMQMAVYYYLRRPIIKAFFS